MSIYLLCFFSCFKVVLFQRDNYISKGFLWKSEYLLQKKRKCTKTFNVELDPFKLQLYQKNSCQDRLNFSQAFSSEMTFTQIKSFSNMHLHSRDG